MTTDLTPETRLNALESRITTMVSILDNLTTSVEILGNRLIAVEEHVTKLTRAKSPRQERLVEDEYTDAFGRKS